MYAYYYQQPPLVNPYSAINQGFFLKRPIRINRFNKTIRASKVHFRQSIHPDSISLRYNFKN